MSNHLVVVILAAGKGTRMKSDLPKVLCLLKGKTLLVHVLNLAKKLVPQRIILIIGYQAEKIKENLSKLNGDVVESVVQKEQLGTGHAVLQTFSSLSDFQGDVLVLSADVPLLSEKSVKKLIHHHHKHQSVVTLLTAIFDHPKGYGRIIRDKGNSIKAIKEEKDLLKGEEKISEINGGVYCFNKKFLFDALGKINNHNAQQEYYLTDTIAIAVKEGLKVEGIPVNNPMEIMGINTKEELLRAEELILN